MKWDKVIYNNTHKIIFKLVELTSHYILHCLPNEEAAQICHKAIAK